jgi:glycerol-3-phosphate dehydrogenase subunit B
MKQTDTELVVIGSGMAGMAAALFAARRGIDVVQVGLTGEINFASGLLDVLGVHPVDKGVRWQDPWAAIAQLVRDEPQHPYGRLPVEQIRTAMARCMDFLEAAGLPYRTNGHQNSSVVTPAGTLKTTYGVPRSMFAGARALAKKTPTLLVDFAGLKGFSARQITQTLGQVWPTLKVARIGFPGAGGELFPEHAARALDV